MAYQITMGNFINDVINVVDEITAKFIQNGYKAIASHWVTSGLLTSVLTLYITYFLYQVKFHNTPISDATNHLIKVCVVFLIATNWDVFYLLIYNVVTNEPLAISDALMTKASGTDGSLNSVFIEGTKKAFELLTNSPFALKGFLSCLLGAILLFIATGLFTISALGLIIISKFYLAILLAIAPYFIFMHLFNGSKGLTESWAKDVINKALIPVFVGCVLLLTSTLAKACLFANESGFSGNKAPDFAGIITYFICAWISLFLFKIIPEKTASLTSSLAMAGASKIASSASKTLGGIKDAGKRIGNAGKNAGNAFKGRQQKQMGEIRARADARKQKAEELSKLRSRGGL
jgi:type IV secretory pathway VirB6-like protein